jgi:hypothetical protein
LPLHIINTLDERVVVGRLFKKINTHLPGVVFSKIKVNQLKLDQIEIK